MVQKAIGGTAFIKVDGRQYALRGALTISPSSVMREGVAGMDGVHGFKETPRVPFIQCDVSDAGEVSISDIQAMNDVTVTAELANGKTYVARSAWTSEAIELDAAEGQFTVKWEAMSVEELK